MTSAFSHCIQTSRSIKTSVWSSQREDGRGVAAKIKRGESGFGQWKEDDDDVR